MISSALALAQKPPSLHVWPLVVKETREIFRNKYLLFLLLVPPIIQLMILGAALDPEVHHASIGVTDYANSPESRQLLASIAASNVFGKRRLYRSVDSLSKSIDAGKLNLGIVIPPTFTQDVELHRPSQVQVLVDATDAYSASIVSSYILRILANWHPDGAVGASDRVESTVASMVTDSEVAKEDQMISGQDGGSVTGSSGNARSGSKAAVGLLQTITGGDLGETPTMHASQLIKPQTLYVYNRGQESSWLFIPGVLGATLTLTSTLVASAAILRERESGTIDQLFMTPAEPWEILVAKILPILTCLMVDVAVAVTASRFVFHLPLRGNVFVLGLGSLLYILVGIGMGMLLGSVCKSQRQAQLTSFFINIPVILLSGTVVPHDSMPDFMKAISVIDPLRYYTDITRGVILKGNGFEILWHQLALLVVFATVMLSVSLMRFKRQTS